MKIDSTIVTWGLGLASSYLFAFVALVVRMIRWQDKIEARLERIEDGQKRLEVEAKTDISAIQKSIDSMSERGTGYSHVLAQRISALEGKR